MYSQNIKHGYAELQRRNDPDIAEVSTLLDQLNSDSENKTFFSNINQIRQSAGAQAQ
ncbi:hypothetical protein HCY52_14900 [Acinetobacter radioresistens]|uniref:hypothetical protein n=1 Tax=Acinetobacter radioresistens TaxID=40216 RepID=UPI002005C577|nr:hypothetical protein [Acinetobacter radioresistens]MCK4085100.1 hypothetical protein [Acinetobacter radioresistens]